MDWNQLFKQGVDLKKKFSTLQEEFKKKIFEGSAGGGLVRAQVKGSRELCSLEISDEITNEKSVLSDLIIAAVNNAQYKLDKEYKEYFGQNLGPLADMSNFPPFSSN